MRDPLKTTGYGVAAGSAASASGAQALAILNAALDDVYRDAYRKFGENVLKNPWQHMMKIEQFLTSHPKWNQAMKNLKKTPEFLLSTSQLKPKPNPNAIYPNANTFKNHIVKVSMNPDTPRYTGSLAKKLNGKIKLLNGWSNRLTWGVPLVLGGISIATAPREMRMQVLFEQGFSIVGGALGTYLGTSMITTGAALLSIFGICISPVGIFIAAFIVGGSLGYYLSEMGKNGGGFLYNEYDNFKKQGYYHSMDDFLGDF